jgi:hypothetical protein
LSTLATTDPASSGKTRAVVTLREAEVGTATDNDVVLFASWTPLAEQVS